MSIETHIQAIADKRSELKTRIAQEMAHPLPNFPLITQLKKQNLKLKEEMKHYFDQLKAGAATG